MLYGPSLDISRDRSLQWASIGICPKNVFLTRVSRDWCIYASARTQVGPWRFISGSVCPSTPFSHQHQFASPSKRAATRKTFGVCRTQMPQCSCIEGLFRPHFAGTWAKGKRSFETDWQLFWEISAQSALTISDLTTDLSDIRASADLWSKPREDFARRAHLQGDRSTDNWQKDRLCARDLTTESMNKGNVNGRRERFSVFR